MLDYHLTDQLLFALNGRKNVLKVFYIDLNLNQLAFLELALTILVLRTQCFFLLFFNERNLVVVVFSVVYNVRIYELTLTVVP
jgi:hypothetical protein